jgi:hypothetical protein
MPLRMKISKLISVLQERMARWGDVEVQGAWAGITSSIEPKHVYRRRDDAAADQRPALVLDLDANRYKRMLALDPREGEDDNGEEDAEAPL